MNEEVLEEMLKKIHEIYYPADKNCSWTSDDLKVFKLFQTTIATQSEEIEHRGKLLTTLAERHKQLQAKITYLKRAVEEKIIKCCETCDSIQTHVVCKTYSKGGVFYGQCPFDSQQKKETDTCDKWNIEALAEKPCDLCGDSGGVPVGNCFSGMDTLSERYIACPICKDKKPPKAPENVKQKSGFRMDMFSSEKE